MKQLDVEALRTLAVVLDHGSITKAAEILHVSRSAASWRIKRLEEHVGQDLLVRDGRTIGSTPAARAILDDTRTLIETHDRIALSLESADLTGVVTIGGDTDSDVAVITRILGSFRRIHPGVDVNLNIDRASRIRVGLAKGTVDVGMIEGTDEHMVPTDHLLWSDDLVWVTGACCSHDDDGVIPLVAFGEDCFYRELGEPLLDGAGIDYRVALTIPSSAGLTSAVADGLGVAVIRRGRLNDRLRIWEPGEALAPLPRVNRFVRTSPHSDSDIVRLLVERLASELRETTRPVLLETA